MAKAYTFDELMAKNKKIANTPLSELYKPNGDAAQGEILDVPSLSRDQAAAQASAAAHAAAKALYTSGNKYKSHSGLMPLMPGMSYTEYLTKGGMNGQAQKEYDAAVRAAETDYAKTLALYGQNAETLGRAGLTGSGYTDYLTGAGFSAMQGAKVAAADTKALTEAQQRLSYADYLAGVEAQNAQITAQNIQIAAQQEAQEAAKQEALAEEQKAMAASIKGTIDQYMQQGMDDKAIMAMIQQHYGNQFDQYLGGWIANAHTYNDPLVAQSAQGAADAASAKYREEIFNQLKAGVDPAIVRSNIEYVMKFSGADTSQLDTWMAEAQAAAQPTVDKLNEEKTKAETEAANARQLEANNAYASLIAGENRYAPSVVERELKNAGYTDDEILEARTNFHDNTFDTGVTNIKMAASVEQLANYSSEALDAAVQAGTISGIQAAQLKQQARAKRAALLEKYFDNVTDENAGAYMQELSNYYKSGDITRDDYADLMSDVVIANLTGVADENEPMTAAIDMIFALKNSPDYNDIVSDLEKSVVNTMEVVKSIPTTVATVSGLGTDSVTIEVTFGNNSENKPSTQQLTLETSKKSASVDLGAGNPGDIKAHNGKLYVYDNYKKAWMELEQPYKRYTGSKEHSAEAYKMLVDYYS